VGGLCAVALAADLLASDQPIACRVGTETFILPGLWSHASLSGQNNDDILDAIAIHGGWAWLPLVPHGPNKVRDIVGVERLATPSAKHVLGTDDSGRDVLARLIHGTRTMIAVAFGSTALYLAVAILLGAVAGYFGGLVDRVTLRLIETFSAFPTFFLILGIQGVIGVTSLWQLVLVIGLTRWTDLARVTRGEVLRLMHEDYVFAAQALGMSPRRVLWRHIMPGAVGPVLVAANFGAASAILIESTLSFLGFGVPSTSPSFGQLITDAFYGGGNPLLLLLPGSLLVATVLCIHLLGDGLRDAVEGS
jgi:peptide/nickel transport system permease protein